MKRIGCIVLLVAMLSGCVFGGIGCAKQVKERTMYEVVVEYKPLDNALTGTVKMDFYNHSEMELDCLQLQLYPNAYRKGAIYSQIGYDATTEAYYAGESYGEISISSVLGCTSFTVGGEDKNLLYAQLDKPLAPNERITLDIGFSTRLAEVNASLGLTKSTVNFAGAFPTACTLTENGFYECVPSDVGQAAVADCADYSVRLTLPREYFLACAGEVVEEKTLESKKQYTISATNMRDFTFSLSTSYAAIEGYTGKTRVGYYYENDERKEEMLALAIKAVEYYSSIFGEYPHKRLALLQTNIVQDAVDYAGVCMLSKGLSKDALVWSVLTKTAAQWWYSSVGANRVENAWLVDGLSAYSAALFLEAHPEYERTKKEIVFDARKEYDEYRDAYRKALGWVDTRMNRPLSTFLNAYEYRCISEHKAVVMLSELEKAVGSKRLLSSLRKYYAENLYGSATPAHLAGAFERNGLAVAGFLESYWAGKGTF